MRQKIFNFIIVTAFLYSLLPPLSAAAGEAWNFVIEPYLLISSIDGDAGVGRVTGAEVDVDFDDILKDLEAGFMIVLEAHHASGWGIMIDYGFMDLGSDISGPLGGIIDVDTHQGILEVLIAKRIDLATGHIEILGGARRWDNEVDVEVDPQVLPGTIATSIDEDWIDPVVGVRYTRPMSEKWQIVLRGDVGGFGVGSDFTAVAAGGILYSFTEVLSLDVQYKALWVDYEDGTKGSPGYFTYDTVTHGPLIGLKIEF
jgi:hypothetical protein